MRYQVGEVVPFVLVSYSKLPGSLGYREGEDNKSDRSGFLAGTYNPVRDQLDSVVIKLLTCKEHHKVRNAYADKDSPATNDGYVFEYTWDPHSFRCTRCPCRSFSRMEHEVDNKFVPGPWILCLDCKTERFQPAVEIWHNQYPFAHYGQLDDSQDRRVIMDVVPYKDDIKSITEQQVVVAMEDGFKRLSSIKRYMTMPKDGQSRMFGGIEQEPEHAREGIRRKFQTLFDFLKSEIEVTAQRKIKEEPLIFHCKDGAEIDMGESGHYDYAFEDQLEAVA